MHALIVQYPKKIVADTKKTLLAQGYRVSCTPSGNSALQWMQENATDLIILNCMLPDISAHDFFKEINKRKISLPRIIVFIDKGREPLAVELLQLGAHNCILKDQLFDDMMPLVIQKATNEIHREHLHIKTQKKLASSEKKYHLVTRQAAMAIATHKVITDNDGQPVDYEFLEVNDAFEKFTDMKAKDIIGKTVREVLPGIENSDFDWITFYGKMTLRGGSEEFEQYSQPLDRWYKVYAYATDYNCFTTLFADITTLKKQNQELEAFFTLNLDLLCIADLEGNFVKTNMAWGRILGYSTHELDNRKFLDFVHPDDMQSTLDAMSTLTQGKDVLNFINRYRCKDGSYRYIEWRSHPRGNLIYAAARDITRRRKTEEKLKRNYEFQLIVSQISSLFVKASSKSFDHDIHTMLSQIGVFFDVDRAYMFLFSEDHKTMTNTHEWCHHSVLPQKDNIADKPTQSLPWWRKMIFSQDYVHIPCVQELAGHAEAEKKEFQNQQIQSLICVPIKTAEKSWGFIGFDAVRKRYHWSSSEIQSLKTIANIIGELLMRLGKDQLLLDAKNKAEKSEQELLWNKKRLDTILSNTPAVIYTYRIRSHEPPQITYINDNVTRILGYKPQDFMHSIEFWFQNVHPNDIPGLEKKLAGTSMTNEYRFKDKKGNYHWLLDNQKVLREEKKFTEIIGTWWDITPQKEAREALRESEEKFRQITETMGEAVWLRSADNRELVYVNPAYEKIWGRTCQSLYHDPHSFIDAVHEQDKPTVMEAFNQYLKSNQFNLTYRIVRPDGKVRWVQTRSFPVLDQNGKTIRHTGIASDVTHKKELDEKFKESQIRLELAMDAGEHGFWDWDLNTNETFFSPAYYTMLGYQDKELPMNLKTFLQLMHPHDAKHIMPRIQKSIAQAKPYEVEFRLRQKNKVYKWIMGKGKVYLDEQSGKPRRVVGVHVDINERKNAENELKEKNKILEQITAQANAMAAEAEMANVAKSEFLATMSHEIRTPMNAILGFSEIMLNTTSDLRQKNYLKTILNSGHSLLSLINDILDLSKIEAGKMDISFEPVDLHLIIEDIRRLFSQTASQKNIDLLVEIDKKFPKTIMIDEVRLRQILLNITGNALKFTNKGYVKISAGILDISHDRVTFKIDVEDTGIGIEAKQQKIIFESFRQASGQDNRKYSGTGLGLSISKKLVELMNGEISLKSKPGRGSTFSMTFKNIAHSEMHIPQKDIHYRDDSPALDFGNQKILIVDDISHNRQLIMDYLGKNNLIFLEAENGTGALEQAEACLPDLILMDIRMPDMDGYQATAILKKDPTLQHIPVIALTASDMEGQERKTEKLFDGYLQKPLKQQPLIKALSKHLRHKPARICPPQIITDAPHSDSSESQTSIPKETKDLFKKRFANALEQETGYVILDDLEMLHKKMKDFNKKHNLPPLEKLLNNLKAYMVDFNLDKIHNTLQSIRKLFL